MISRSGDQPFGSLNRLRADQNRSTDRQIGRRSAQLKCYRCLLLMLTSRAVRRRLPVWRVDVARCIPFSFDGTMLTSCCWSGRRMFLEVLQAYDLVCLYLDMYGYVKNGLLFKVYIYIHSQHR